MQLLQEPPRAGPVTLASSLQALASQGLPVPSSFQGCKRHLYEKKNFKEAELSAIFYGEVGRNGGTCACECGAHGGGARSPQWHYEGLQHADRSVSVAEPARGRWRRARTACKMEAGC